MPTNTLKGTNEAIEGSAKVAVEGSGAEGSGAVEGLGEVKVEQEGEVEGEVTPVSETVGQVRPAVEDALQGSAKVAVKEATDIAGKADVAGEVTTSIEATDPFTGDEATGASDVVHKVADAVTDTVEIPLENAQTAVTVHGRGPPARPGRSARNAERPAVARASASRARSAPSGLSR
jgi:hypothetical protein